MQIVDVLCYVFLTITVTASCVGAAEQKKEIKESEPEKRVTKRGAMILDNFPLEKVFQKPKMIYRRISNQRYGGPMKAKYAPPKPKYGPSKRARKPVKKALSAKPRPSPTYGPPSKKRDNKQKIRRGRPKVRPGFGHIVKLPHYSFFIPGETGFGEPPVLSGDTNYHRHKQSYGEPPEESFVAPVPPKIKDAILTQSLQETTNYLDVHDFNRQEYQTFNNKYNPSPDSNYAALAKKHPTFTIPDHTVFVTPEPKIFNEESLDANAPDKQVMQDKFFFRKKRPLYFTDNSKVVNRPWRSKYLEVDDEIVVGGQYAEPPARIAPKFQLHAPPNDEEDRPAFAALHVYDSNGAASATNSPFSIYKNSNMAFSPQNVNDAFSIVDK